MDSPDSDKLPVSQSKIYNYTSIVQRNSTSRYFSYTVDNYSDISKNIFYRPPHEISDKNFNVYFIKRRESHFFELHCDLEDTMTFFVEFSETELSKPISVEGTVNGYSVEVPNTVVEDPRNKYLAERNSLVVRFHYRWENPVVRAPLALYGRRTRQDEEQFSGDMMKLYVEGQKTGNFCIKVGKDKYRVHKHIFAARSTFFKENPKFWDLNEISIKGEPSVMSLVLEYMYRGEIQLSVKDMLNVLGIAISLGMRSLIETVHVASKTALAKDVAQKVAKEMKQLNLKHVAKTHLPERETAAEKKRRKKNFKKHR